MKKRDLYLILSVLAAAAIIWAGSRILQKNAGSSLTITIDGVIDGVYPLDQEQEIPIGDTNVCRIQDGKAVMVRADCPDQVCVHSAAIYREGQTIICMPNRIVLEVTESSEDGIDLKAQ